MLKDEIKLLRIDKECYWRLITFNVTSYEFFVDMSDGHGNISSHKYQTETYFHETFNQNFEFKFVRSWIYEIDNHGF